MNTKNEILYQVHNQRIIFRVVTKFYWRFNTTVVIKFEIGLEMCIKSCKIFIAKLFYYSIIKILIKESSCGK